MNQATPMKTLPPCDHDECPPTRCVQNANAKGVGFGDGLGDISRQYALEQYKPMPDAERTAGSLHRDCCAASWSVKPLFAWYDFWVGIFWDSRKRKLYILPLPCVGVVIEIPSRHNAPDQRPAPISKP